MSKPNTFTSGPIFPPLVRFAFPILGALILQAAYGAVDVAVVGQFASPADVSAVSTGTQLMHTITSVIIGLSMGSTVLIGQYLGAGEGERSGKVMGAAICLFGAMGLFLSLLLPFLTVPLCRMMNAPQEAFPATVRYVRICSIGTICIVAYNILGSVFRGMGDSRTPLLTVLVAALCNVGLDILLVAGFGMEAAGAAVATVISQGLSVVFCVLVVRRKGLAFPFRSDMIRFDGPIVADTLRVGAPVALQDLLVSISFLVIMAVVNRLGTVKSAGMGVAERLCAFIMLIPSAFSQALAAVVAQNIGARQPGRARRAMLYGMLTSFGCGVVMAYLSFFHGDMLSRLFARDADVIAASWDYLRAYAIDTMLVAFLFCFIGYFNGCGRTRFTMLQGVAGAFGVRVPVSAIVGSRPGATLFQIGLATPCSTIVQIVLCVWYLLRRRDDPADVRSFTKK